MFCARKRNKNSEFKLATEVQTVLQMGTGGDQVTTKERYISHVDIALQPPDRVGLV